MKTILYVEDLPDNQNLVRLVLESEGYRVLIAQDGAIGYQMALDHKPDLILMDVNLPGEDGYSVMKRLLTIDAFRKVPFIVLEANVRSGGGRDGQDPLMGQRMQRKPIEIDLLLENVSLLLAKDASE